MVPRMVTKTIVHFEIPASDVESLSKFYSDVFGWKFEKAPMPDFDYWLISTGPRGKSVGGGMYKKDRDEDRPRNFIGVDEIDSAIEVFKSAGGKEVMSKQEVPGQGWSFIGADPEGNVLALWQQTSKPRQARRTATRKKKRSTKQRR
jgi:predicted enzyme related to lactoylglutathione lyase